MKPARAGFFLEGDVLYTNKIAYSRRRRMTVEVVEIECTESCVALRIRGDSLLAPCGRPVEHFTLYFLPEVDENGGLKGRAFLESSNEGRTGVRACSNETALIDVSYVYRKYGPAANDSEEVPLDYMEMVLIELKEYFVIRAMIQEEESHRFHVDIFFIPAVATEKGAFSLRADFTAQDLGKLLNRSVRLVP